MLRSALLVFALVFQPAALLWAQENLPTPKDQKKGEVAPPRAVYKLPFPENHSKVIDQAAALGAPMVALHKALKEAESSSYSKKDVVSLFDLSQHASKKRYYTIDLKAGLVSAYHASHGKGNGGHEKATSFRGFNETGSNKTPLGPLKTGSSGYPWDGYEYVKDDLTGKSYSGQLILDVIGTKRYNSNIHKEGIWVVIHTKWYTTEGYRKANNGVLGRSLGCIVFDPAYNNKIINRTKGGSLIYITVGNDSIEKYL